VVDETDPEAPSPLPDEILDDLVTVLDEIRLGRSRSRSELVQRTGLGRAIVGRRGSRRDADRDVILAWEGMRVLV